MSQESLKELRNQQGWSQTDLAALSGISVKTIQRIENGQGAPSAETAKALGSVFDKPFSAFLSSPETRAQSPGDNPASTATTASPASPAGPVNLLHKATRYWRQAALVLLLVTSVGILAKLYLTVESLSADVSEISTLRNFESAESAAEGNTLFELNLQRETGVFSDYYGNYVTVALQSNKWDAGIDNSVSLLENRMLRDIARIVSAWERSAGPNPDVRSHTILKNNLHCYRDARSPLDSTAESIVKMYDCIVVVLSDANWQLDHEVDHALKLLARDMERTTPFYRALRVDSVGLTQQ